MNWMLIIVIIIFLIAIFRGWRCGLLRLLFSLVSIVLLIWLFSALNPYISSFIKERTGLYAWLEEKCTQWIGDQFGSGLSFLTGSVADTAADWILKGITFLVTFLIALVIVLIIFRLLKLFNRIPVLGKVNRVLGLIGGAVEGYIVVCLVLLFVSMISGTELGGTLAGNIEKNSLLTFLNDNNFLLQLNLFN